MIHRVRRRDVFAELARARAVRRGPVWVRTAVIADAHPQLAFAIGRRSGSAVARNRLRRRLRSAARSAGLAPGNAYLVGVAPGAERASFRELDGALRACLEAGDVG